MVKNKKQGQSKQGFQTEEEYLISRIKLPKGNQVIGIIEQRLGAGRSRVRCLDGHTRVCRVPGKVRRYIWLREGDIVLVQPWEFQSNEKGDIIFKYRPAQVEWLKQKGLLKIEELDEF